MKRWDYAVIGIVVMLSLLPLLFFIGGADARVTVSVRGETVYVGRLAEDAVVHAGEGNTVTIRNGRVTMSRADCPDHTCMRGEATALHPLVCLPNAVVVTVAGGEEAYDGVTY